MIVPYFNKRIEDRIALAGNPICMGMDPVPALIQQCVESDSIEDCIYKFYINILNCMIKRNVYVAVVKPNIAYYECLGFKALSVLQQLIHDFEKENIPVILDAKRGDIGKSSAAYAKAIFNIYNADAVTVSPWMGEDSVLPFRDSCGINRGVYVLLRTSNKGAHDFQDLPVYTGEKRRKTKKIFYSVADKIAEWDNGRLGAVVGATKPEELEKITAHFVSIGHEIPFLIPGVSIPGVPGGQGGSAKAVLKAIKNGGGKRQFHVLNSSSGLNYAFQNKGNPANFANDCIDAIERLSEECSNI